MLTNVIYSFINMTHGQILKYRTCYTDQRCTCLGQKTRLCIHSRYRDGRSVQYFQETGIPLYSRSQEGWNQNPNSRTQDCIYRQAISESYSSVKRLYKNIRNEFKRARNPGLRKISLQRPEAWLKEIKNKLSWIIVLTDYQPRNLQWHTNF